MLLVRQTDVFVRWRSRLRDERAKALIASRLDRLAFGHGGDAKPVGPGLFELRIHHRPGYRIYFHRRDRSLIVLLCGGQKSSQARDIEAARKLLSELQDDGDDVDDV